MERIRRGEYWHERADGSGNAALATTDDGLEAALVCGGLYTGIVIENGWVIGIHTARATALHQLPQPHRLRWQQRAILRGGSQGRAVDVFHIFSRYRSDLRVAATRRQAPATASHDLVRPHSSSASIRRPSPRRPRAQHPSRRGLRQHQRLHGLRPVSKHHDAFERFSNDAVPTGHFTPLLAPATQRAILAFIPATTQQQMRMLRPLSCRELEESMCLGTSSERVVSPDPTQL